MIVSDDVSLLDLPVEDVDRSQLPSVATPAAAGVGNVRPVGVSAPSLESVSSSTIASEPRET